MNSFRFDEFGIDLIDQLTGDTEKSAVNGFCLYFAKAVAEEDKVEVEDVSESVWILFEFVKF